MKSFLHKFSLVATVFTISALLLLGITPLNARASTRNSNQQDKKQAASSCLQPPQHVDLMTLSDAALVSYGFPSHAVMNANPALWSDVLAHAKHHTCETSKKLIKRRTLFPRVMSSRVKHYTNNDIWADNEATGARGTYGSATLTFNVPFLGSGQPSNAVDSVWVGLGGDGQYLNSNSVVLPQIGVDSTASGSDSCGNHQYNESWWELAEAGDTGATNLPLTRLCAGDRIYIYVSSNLQNDGENYYYIENMTTGDFNPYTPPTKQDFSDGATGECVQERLGDGTAPVAQPNPNAGSAANTIEIDNCDINNLNDTPNGVGNWPHFAYQITNSSGQALVTPQPLFNSGQNFLFQWKQLQ